MLLQVETQASEQIDCDAIYKRILTEESISIYRFPLGFQQTHEFTQVCLEFFDDPYLPDHDPRKNLAYAYSQLESSDEELRFNKENATIAYYLSENPSYRRRGSRAVLEPNIRQMARAIHNIDAYQDLHSRYNASAEAFEDLSHQGVEISFARTDNISATNLRRMGKESREVGVQACPEALYQLRLFENGQYIARIGFNIHKENGQTVVSIVNMQGAEGTNFAEFKNGHGEEPINILLKRLLAFQQADRQTLLFRGIKNHPKGSHMLYNAALGRFKKQIVKMSYIPKPRYPNGLE